MQRTHLPTLTLVFVGLFTLAYFWFTHEGIYDFDDHAYARYAHQLVSDTFQVAPPPGHDDHNPLHNRFLVFGPVALLYSLFGVGIISTTLWPLLCTLGALGLIWFAYRRHAPVAASVAILLLGLHYFALNLANYLYPDNILLFFALSSATALVVGRRREQNFPVGWGIGFALLSFLALLSKETIAYYLPFYTLVLVRDVWYRRHLQFWSASLLAGVVLLTLYFAFYHLVAHDALYPLHVVEHTNEKLKHHNYSLGRSDLWARITWQPPAMLLGIGLGIAVLLAVRAASQWRQSQGSEVRFWVALAGTSLALYWVGSTSLTYYNPNSLLPRMLTPILPPLCLAAGFGAEQFVRTGRGAGWLALGLLAAAAWLHNSLSVLYGLPGLYLVAVALLGGRYALRFPWLRTGTTGFAGLFLLVLALSLSIRPAYFITKPSRSEYFAQHRLLQRELRGAAGGIVLADDFLLRNYDFSYGFQVPSGLRFLPYAAYDTLRPVAGRPTWLLLNRAILSNDDLVPNVIRYTADEVLAKFPTRRLVAQDGRVALYRIQ
ncbi:glycosyltransferase family protein [Hymenobacter tenuis]